MRIPKKLNDLILLFLFLFIFRIHWNLTVQLLLIPEFFAGFFESFSTLFLQCLWCNCLQCSDLRFMLLRYTFCFDRIYQHRIKNTLFSLFSLPVSPTMKDFKVSIRRTDAAERCDLRGPYLLRTDFDSLLLKDPKTGEVLYTWPYRYLRRFGRDKVAWPELSSVTLGARI